MKHTIKLPFALLLLFAGATALADELPPGHSGTLTIVHLNDTYRVGDVEEGRRGGLGRVATIVRKLKAQGNDVRITHAGDFLYPSLESQLWHGEQMVEALNYLHSLAPLYLVPGNHEFDRRTADAVVQALHDAEFAWIADNLQLKTGHADADAALGDAFLFAFGSKKIGIFALTLLPRDGGNERTYAPVSGEYLAVAEAAIEKLEQAGADLIFGLTHLHLADDRQIAALKHKHPSFLFIVGGHEHEPEFLSGDADSATIMKGASNARTVWQIDIRFDDKVPVINTTEIAVDQSIEKDAAYQLIADKWRQRLLQKLPFLQSTLGVAALPLDAREVTVRNRESAWANFIVDQMPGAFGKPLADFAFINSGTLRIDDFVAEDITFEDIGRTFGFSSFLRHMTINGADFVALMEAGFRGEGPSKGYFPQISGFRVCVDKSRPDGQRIVQLQLPAKSPEQDTWIDIDRTADYQLVAPDFLYRGGDGYEFSQARDASRPASELKYLVLDAVIQAQGVGARVGAAVDLNNPRIAFVENENSTCFTKK